MKLVNYSIQTETHNSMEDFGAINSSLFNDKTLRVSFCENACLSYTVDYTVNSRDFCKS